MTKGSQKSKRWREQQESDPYVKQARQLGYRSRAAFKLIEIQQKDQLIKPVMCIVELGSAPGSWSQLLAEWVGKKGQVIAVDILPMKSVPEVEFIQGDFTESTTYDALLSLLAGKKVDLVISDMAPNISGIKSVDQAKMAYLAELSLDFSHNVLKSGGGMLIKLFHGSEFDQFIKTVRQYFNKVVIRKPKASRSHSKEAYLLAKDYNL